MASSSAFFDTYRAVHVPAPGPPSVMTVATLPRAHLFSLAHSKLPDAASTQPADALPRGTVLIRTLAVGVNPVETYIRSGVYAGVYTYPHTLGHDAVGVVEDVGAGVARLAVGELVYTVRTLTGAYAEHIIADEQCTFRVTPRWPGVGMSGDMPAYAHKATMLATPAHTAYRALFHVLNITPGATVLIHGATGSVGMCAVQMAHAHGLRVIGTAGSQRGAASLAPYCDAVVMHGKDSTVADVIAANGGSGVNYIVEMLGNVNLASDLKMLARGGRVAIVGSRGDATISPRDIMRIEASVMGVMLFNATAAELAVAAAYIERAFEAGTLSPAVAHVYAGLTDAPAAHEEVISHSGGAAGRIVINIA